ncbi:glutaredoxin 3 [Motiliproteus sediminis]|uniref:glutaredoxin 3 n=1 Tax=Motiliproteus sediminis TaxID=1468178 RepID=UPI001AEF3FF4
MARIEIYTTAYCPYCIRAKMLLTQKQASFDEIAVDGDAEKRRAMMARARRHTVPQIFIDDTHIGGCDELYALERSGQLDALLSGEKDLNEQ